MIIRDAPSCHTAAANAATEFRTQPQGVQPPQFQEQSKGRCRLNRLDQSQALDRELEEPFGFGTDHAFRRKAIEHLHQEAGQRIARRLHAESEKGIDQLRPFEKGHCSPGLCPAVDGEMVEDVERAGKATMTPARRLRDCREATMIGSQKMHDPVGFTVVDRPKQ